VLLILIGFPIIFTKADFDDLCWAAASSGSRILNLYKTTVLSCPVPREVELLGAALIGAGISGHFFMSSRAAQYLNAISIMVRAL
jgi:hypothetical protein